MVWRRSRGVRGTAMAVMAVVGTTATAVATAASTMVSEVIERVEITTNSALPARPSQLAGGVDLLTRDQLDARRPPSIIEALRELPGLNVVAEDTAGTHLNIGLRGLNPRRSSRLLLLEDGAPTVFFAAYSDPSSHYTTPLHRIERIELIKGASQVLHGPQTLGGVLNFVTRAVPRSGTVGGAEWTLGNQGFRDVSAHVGRGGAQGGFVIDWGQRRGQGIRAEHGFDLRDVALKTELRLTPDQTLTGKWSRFEETSRFSETGFTAAEFLTQPRGVPASAGERFLMTRDVAQVVHDWTLGPRARLTSQAYFSRVFRESQRLREFEPNDAEAGLGELSIEPAIRPRRYRVSGIEPRLQVRHAAFGANGELTVGMRLHREDVDRRKFLTDGLRGPIAEADERLSINVQALSSYVQNRIVSGPWVLTQGVRLEDIRQTRRLFHSAGDPRATEFDARPIDAQETRQREILPGLGVNWNGLPGATVFAGVHRGFAPPRPDRDIADDRLQQVTPEMATITEVGLRASRTPGADWGLSVFNMDIRDLVVQVGGVFRNEGRARHTGFDLDARLNPMALLGHRPGPLTFRVAYTHLAAAKFLGSGTVGGEGEDGYGAYEAGGRLPYTPKHTLTMGLLLDAGGGWKARVGANHLSRQFANTENLRGTGVPGFCPQGDRPDEGAFCGLYGEIPAVTLFNAGLSYTPPRAKVSYFASVDNLTDRRYIAARTNGIQPGRGRLVTAGVRMAF